VGLRCPMHHCDYHLLLLLQLLLLAGGRAARLHQLLSAGGFLVNSHYAAVRYSALASDRRDAVGSSVVRCVLALHKKTD